MPRQLIVSPRARLQLLDILDYLDRHSPTASQRLTERLKATYQQLVEFPQSGRRAQMPGTRRLIVAPYVLTYREISADLIEIIDIRHGRQRPGAFTDDA